MMWLLIAVSLKHEIFVDPPTPISVRLEPFRNASTTNLNVSWDFSVNEFNLTDYTITLTSSQGTALSKKVNATDITGYAYIFPDLIPGEIYQAKVKTISSTDMESITESDYSEPSNYQRTGLYQCL